jgi:hypothetical protein
MKRFSTMLVVCAAIGLPANSDLFARGGGGGGRGGGGGYRGGGGAGMSRAPAGRTPAVSRPAYGSSAVGASRPSAPRPNVSRPSVTPPARVSPPISGTRPNVGTRPGAGVATRPSAGQLNNFLDVHPSGGARPGTLPASQPGNRAGAIAAAAGGGAAAEFLRDSSARPATLPAGGQRPGAGIVNRPGTGDRPGVGERPGIGNRPMAQNRPDRIDNRQEWRQNRTDRRNEVRDQVRDNHPRFNFWSNHPNWAAWRISHPYRWATWGVMAGWMTYGWVTPVYYNYGENVYYQDDSVYYGNQAVASAEEYADQAEAIAASAPQIAPEQTQWMPLGVFALTPDGQASGPDPTLYLQLAISKEGIINGTLYNSATNGTQDIEGMADKATQRAAWTVAGKNRPLMETGIANLTQDTAPALVHFADGQTQQWLMVRLDEPQPDNKTGQ